MKLIWSIRARSDIERLLSYIARDNPLAADELVTSIFDSVEHNLPDNPNLGRVGRVEGTRELVAHKNYIVVYRIGANSIEILSVYHAARLWPAGF